MRQPNLSVKVLAMDTNIDLLVEKYAMGFKKFGSVRDVFVNPTKQELKELGNIYRFIADAKHKKLYVFDHNLFHVDVWERLKVELKDPRSLYQAYDMFGGAIESNRVFNWGFNDRYYDYEVIEYWLEEPTLFKWTKKWVDIDVWMKKNDHKMKEFVKEYTDYE